MDAAMRALRKLRQTEHLALIWRECASQSNLWATCQAQSAFADACLMQTLQWLQRHTPQGRERPPLLVFALGKLGAQALNLSSDVDLVFMRSDQSQKEVFYSTMARDFVHFISARTSDGFVFRVDTRLRPDGKSGALVATQSAMRAYYQKRAREWERFAWTRARSLNKDEESGEFLRFMENFIYKNYSDYSVVDWLRSSPWRAHQAELDCGQHADFKQGAGGIREIEFIAQTFQLIHSGKDRHLRGSRMLSILRRLSHPSYLGEKCETLIHAYEFLRDSEHAAQMMNDQQTHRIPQSELGKLQLAYLLGFDGEKSWMDYLAAYETVRHDVQMIFAELTSPVHYLRAQEEEDSLRQCLDGSVETAPQALRLKLQTLGLDDERAARDFIALSHKAKRYKLASQVLPRVLGTVLHALPAVDILQRQQALEGFLGIIEIGLGRPNYLVLLSEVARTSERVLQLCAKSSWLSGHLNRHLFALEYLGDEIPIGAQIDFNYLKKYLSDLLRHDLSVLPESKPDLPMNYLRRFKQGWLMRIAYADVSGSLPLMKLSDYLTAVADAVIMHAMELAWDYLKGRHGAPLTEDGGELTKEDFLMLAYGKLGSLEMGYASDCDLVFIYRPVPVDALSNGKRPITASQFFVRLGQRIIHLLNNPTTAGVAYEIDMRLRPDGSQGLLVSSMDAYRRYQLHKARLWEKQALTRARPINADTPLAKRFAALRRQALSGQAAEGVREGVLEVRQKTRAQKKPPEDRKSFHLKHSSGGCMDIEFLVQCCVLTHARKHPSVIDYTDNMRQLDELLACGCLRPQQGLALQSAWQHLRALAHSCVLRSRPLVVPFDEVERSACSVKRVWREIMEPD